MVDVIAERLGADPQAVSDAMHEAWDATRDLETGTGFSWQPDLSNPGQALAHRVQQALEREFDGEDLFPCVVVVQDLMSNHIGLAATAVPAGEIDHLLLLGRGAAKRTVRQALERQHPGGDPRD